MTTIYQEQPRTDEGTGAGLVAGLVLVLAVIALVFLATRAAPLNRVIDTTPNTSGAGAQIQGSGTVQGGVTTNGNTGTGTGTGTTTPGNTGGTPNANTGTGTGY